jgi:type IV pilus assembly protein PilN
MIRINLLQVERTAKPKRGGAPSLQLGSLVSKAPLLSSLILVAAFVYVGYEGWMLYVADQQVEQELQQQRAEEARLAPVLKQVEDFEARKKQLQQRVQLIEQLRRGQAVPVHLLDKVSRSLPDRLWLTNMQEFDDASVQLDGQTSTLTSLADFVGNLENSGYFVRPVEIISSEEQRGLAGQNGLTLIRFSMKAQFVMPGQEPPVKPGTVPPATH